MLIRENRYGKIVPAYAMYWSDNKRHYLFIPYEGYEGLQVTDESSCDLISDDLTNFEILRMESGSDIILHKAIKKDVLLDRLTDYDAEAMAEFLNNLKSYIS
jgi:hypothetical protein